LYADANLFNSDMIDFEKFSITGDVFKMLLGSFVEEMDAINDDMEDTALDDSPPTHPSMSTPTKTLPMQPIFEEYRDTYHPTVRRADTQSSSSTPQKSNKSRLSRFLGGK